MVDFKHIYATRAEDYHALVSFEDYQQQIAQQLATICDFDGQQVIEFGAGTGRLTRLLATQATIVHASDRSMHMLHTARLRLSAANCTFTVADNRHMPFQAQAADVTVAGWSLGHLVGWHPSTWEHEIDAALHEMLRLLRPGGTAIIFETMGTGQTSPQPPTEGLAAYYHRLVTHHNFSTTTFRTDYRFPSVAEGARLTRFFFGDALADQLLRNQQTILPECTGVWWRQR